MSHSTSTMIKSLNNSFHTKYLNLCKAKNFLPNHEITKNRSKLEVVADRLKINEWQMVTKALEQDNSLQSIVITSRRAVQCVREQIVTEKRCREMCAKGDPIISTNDLIKFQTINRYSDEWMKSFRYQERGDSDTPPGLKCLVLNGNIELGDRGLQRIVMDLKDDEWIKAIEFQNCGLTDAGGSAVIECLKCNKTIAVLDINCNPKMSKRIFAEIQKMLGAEVATFEVGRKESTMKLREAIDLLEQRLEMETTNREQANKMNVQLHNKLIVIPIQIGRS